jgi:hypothetical protein
LGIFFHDQLPMTVGLRRAFGGGWLVSAGDPWLQRTVLVIVGVTVVAAVVLCLARRGRTRSIGIAIVAFPFLFVLSPASWNWQDGRYDSYLPPLLAMALAVGCCEAARRFHRVPPDGDGSGSQRSPRAGVLAMSAVVVLCVTLTLTAFFEFTGHYHRALTRTWGNPDGTTMAAIAKLESGGVTTGYADYWVAYKLDFLSRGRLVITTAGYDADRSRAINAAVVASGRPAWLFVPKRDSQIDGTQFSAPSLTIGPDGVPESQFLATLHKLGVGYRIIDTGIVQAVLPDRRVTQGQARLPGVAP